MIKPLISTFLMIRFIKIFIYTFGITLSINYIFDLFKKLDLIFSISTLTIIITLFIIFLLFKKNEKEKESFIYELLIARIIIWASISLVYIFIKRNILFTSYNYSYYLL